jgi:hypothetical protein
MGASRAGAASCAAGCGATPTAFAVIFPSPDAIFSPKPGRDSAGFVALILAVVSDTAQFKRSSLESAGGRSRFFTEIFLRRGHFCSASLAEMAVSFNKAD